MNYPILQISEIVEVKEGKKTLSEAIKCSERINLPKQVVKSFNTFHKSTCGESLKQWEEPLETEQLIVCDGNGNIIAENKNGEKASTEIPWKELCLQHSKDGTEVYITHNHPNPYYGKAYVEWLSQADVGKLFQGYRLDDDGILMTSQYLRDGLNNPIKGISCESPNGSRMSLVRGDNFNYEDVDEVLSLSRKLSDLCRKSNDNYMDNHDKIFNEHNDEMDSFPTFGEFEHYVFKQNIKENGSFRDSKEFKDLQKEFRKYGCKLTIDYPYDYDVVTYTD